MLFGVKRCGSRDRARHFQPPPQPPCSASTRELIIDNFLGNTTKTHDEKSCQSLEGHEIENEIAVADHVRGQNRISYMHKAASWKEGHSIISLLTPISHAF
jgi:hypothetical protein